MTILDLSRRDGAGATPASAHASAAPTPGAYLAGKATTDCILAALILAWTLPLIVLAMILTRLTSAGPVIFKQVRVGLGGRPFTIYKIRTMRADCERETGPVWSSGRDPRVTPLGRFLRSTHLDELPQLVNVLRGEMSLVGPRPERPEFVAQLERAIPCYRDRLEVRPGLTGLAQLQLAPDTDLESVRRKLACDLYYIRRASPWLDLRILLSTSWSVSGIPFGVSRVLLGIPSGVVVEEAYCDMVSRAMLAGRLRPA